MTVIKVPLPQVVKAAVVQQVLVGLPVVLVVLIPVEVFQIVVYPAHQRQRVENVMLLVDGEIDNISIQDDGFKIHVKIQDGSVKQIQRKKKYQQACHYGYQMNWNHGRKKIFS